ncbi:MAG: hypothetical protein HWD82_07105 [Flavobacteriaceae bacterium]|nr:hypothetical protein [Flavobacteriaceae bacterium]
MKNIKIYLIALVTSVFAFYGCEEESEPQNTNFITFAKSATSTQVDAGSSTTASITVYTANISSSDRAFNVTVDGSGAPDGSYSVPSTVTVPGGTNEGTLEVTINDPKNIAQNSIVISFSSSDGLFTGDPTTLTFSQSCNEVEATLEFVFDGYGSEISWEVVDELGAVIASKATASYADGQASATETFNLCQSRLYTFTIYDSYGDGLSFPADGTYTLSVGGVTKASGSGNFGSSETTNFNTN